MLVLVAGTAWVALVYTGPVPTIPQLGQWNDKALHFGAFGVLALLVVLPGPAPRAVFLLGMSAVVLELTQLAFPLRRADLADLCASLAGLAFGWAFGGVGRTLIAVVGSSVS